MDLCKSNSCCSRVNCILNSAFCAYTNSSFICRNTPKAGSKSKNLWEAWFGEQKIRIRCTEKCKKDKFILLYKVLRSRKTSKYRYPGRNLSWRQTLWKLRYFKLMVITELNHLYTRMLEQDLRKLYLLVIRSSLKARLSGITKLSQTVQKPR